MRLDQTPELNIELESIPSESGLERRVAELEGQLRGAVEASKQKSRFVASLSHELRTPLTSIIGFTEMLLEDTDEPLTAGQRKMMMRVNENSGRLLQMITDLLNLAKMESGRTTVNLSLVDLPALIHQVIETMQPIVRGTEVTLVGEVDGEIPPIRTDGQKLGQILVNLVSNAIKFTPKGAVTLRAERKGSKVVIKVTDTGIGISRSDFGRIFEEFRQIETPHARRNGSGLGLAITRRLVKLLGGEITVSSKLGQGSTFTVTLPVSLSSRS